MYGTRIARKNNALIFDGINDYVEVPHSASISPTEQITLSAWIKTSSTATQAIIVKWDQYFIRLDEGRVFFFLNEAFVWHSLGGTKNIADNTWHFVQGVYDGSDMIIYVDGVEEARKSLTITINVNPNRKLHIGSELAETVFFDGIIDEVRIYNRALTATEISKLYKGQNIANGLVLYLDFNELGGNKCLDLSGYKNDGTIYGAQRSILRTGGLNFDGENDHIEIPHDPSINPTKELTVAAWVKSATENWNVHAWIVSERNAYIMHPVKDSKVILFYIYDTGWHYVSYVPTFDIREWHYYVGTYKDGYLRLYIDGELVAGPVGPYGDINVDPGSLYIGCDDLVEAPGRYGKGVIDEVRIYNRALSQDEIRSLYRGKSITKGLVLYFPMNEYSGNKVYDNSGFENHGVIYT